MKTEIHTSYPETGVDTLAVPMSAYDLEAALAHLAGHAGVETGALFNDFKAYRETRLAFYPGRGRGLGRRIVLLGLGREPSPAALRRALRKFVHEELASLNEGLAIDLLSWSNLDPASSGPADNWVQAAVEGCFLGAYSTGGLKTGEAIQGERERARQEKRLERLELFVPEQHQSAAHLGAQWGEAVGAAQTMAASLVDAPANRLTPQELAEAARRSGLEHGFTVTVLGKKEIEAEGMGGLLAVNRGSTLPPTFTIMEYRPESRSDSLPRIGLVGKGVTFDTGGISLKPPTDLGFMKSDMAGGAAVIGAVEAAARLRLPIHLIGVVPATENKPDASAQTPGDVIRTFSGVTVEVEDTDAEGRLILADALAFLEQRFDPDTIIDLATLTGACTVALGHHAAGLFSNDDDLARRLEEAGAAADERLWRLPLWKEYDRQIESDVADLRNIGGRSAGAVTAARFLYKFVGESQPWAHLDIAGTAYTESDFARRRGATGFGVRLLAEYLKGL